jgi:hypothetical protein
MMPDRFAVNEASLGTDSGDRRAAVLREENEREALRQSRLAAQSSPTMTAAERIKLWEELHGVRLPRDASHKLVGVIARETALSVQQIQDEQVRRSAGSVPVGAMT